MQRFVWFVLFVLQCCIHVWCLLFLFCNYGLQEDILSTVRLLPSFHWTRILYKILLCFFANHLGLLVFIWPACYAPLRIRRTCRSVFNQLLVSCHSFRRATLEWTDLSAGISPGAAESPTACPTKNTQAQSALVNQIRFQSVPANWAYIIFMWEKVYHAQCALGESIFQCPNKLLWILVSLHNQWREPGSKNAGGLNCTAKHARGQLFFRPF